MTISSTPAPARSDVRFDTSAAPRTRHPYRIHGRVLSAGAMLWSAGIMTFGNNPTDTLGLAVFGLSSGAFQVGLLFLLRALWRSRALGEGRLSRAVLRVEAGMVCLAIGSTFVDSIGISDLTQPGWILLDAFWPLSMLGMFLIGIRIAVAGRWTGAARFWPLVAESWAVVVIPTMVVFGSTASAVVASLHLLVGYTVLGVLVSRKVR
ncbi:MAG TPA: hypothetical protein VER39_06940 [Nocardioidaceae bacterium]|nr:hypothetical protein [Nocardioidaceae bacterium]